MTVEEREQRWYSKVGASLALNRHLRNWTLYDVAAVLGVTPAAVSRWERGTRRMKAYEYDLLRREGLLHE